MIEFVPFLPNHGTMPFELQGATQVFRQHFIKICWEVIFSPTGRPSVRLEFSHLRPSKREKEIYMADWIAQEEQVPFAEMQQAIFWNGLTPSDEFHDIVQSGPYRYVDIRFIGV